MRARSSPCPKSSAPQGSRINLAGNDLEHVVVFPSGLLAPTTKAGLAATIVGDDAEGDFISGEVAAGNAMRTRCRFHER